MVLVTVKTNVAQFRKGILAEIAALNKSVKDIITRAAKFDKLQAKLLAPKLSGRLIGSIKIRRIKKGKQVSVNAVGNDGFPYPAWVNQSEGFETLTFPTGNRVLSPGAVATYGSEPDWSWSGKPRFFLIAAQRTLRKFPQISQQAINQNMGRKFN